MYLPGAGWIGLDATSGLLTGEGHIPLAASPDPLSAAPISGGVEAAEVDFSVEMKVTRIAETPRVTKPYTEAQWQAILAAGRARRPRAGGRRGAPDHGRRAHLRQRRRHRRRRMDLDALGPTKRAYAGRLLRRLLPLWAPGAAITTALGKHYPGEQLPRWALSAHWRRDGEPVWRDPACWPPTTDTGCATAVRRARVLRRLAERLQVAPASSSRPTRTSTITCGRSTACRPTCWPRPAS